MKVTPEFLDELSRRLTDEGRLVEAGWVALRRMAVSPDAPDAQIQELRCAFMAGAQHLFASIMAILDPGDEPSAADLKRMDLISEELERFGNELAARLPTKGTA